MRKVLLIGSAGAGKTVLATKLGELLDLPVIHLDALFWQPGWKETPRDTWKQIVAELVRRECWIMDGNYGGTLTERLAACDTVVFLAFPRLICLYRVVKRAVTHLGRTRPDLTPGCPEQLPDREFLSWIWTYPRRRAPGILETLKTYEGEKEIYILKSRREVAEFLTAIERRFASGLSAD